jgi:hypothetical protein
MGLLCKSLVFSCLIVYYHQDSGLLPLICDETVSNIFLILESMSCVEKSFGVAGLYGIWMARLQSMLPS